MRTSLLALLLSIGCSSKRPDARVDSDSAPVDSGDPPADDSAPQEDSHADSDGAPGGDSQDTGTPPEPPGPLQVTYLGVGGVALRFGDDLIVTAPMLTNPDMITVTLGETVSDPDLVRALLPGEEVFGAAAILVGHAHYDHLLDVPTVADMAGSPVIYGNLSAQNLLAGVSDVVAVDDPADPHVDRRMCAKVDPCTGLPAGLEGDWIAVPGSHVRVLPLCSMHPGQLLGIAHYGEGCVDEPQDSPPTYAGDWLEGSTLSWLIDFLDEDGQIAYRVYYQDAPTNAPTGDVHPDLLAERGVDLALLCVGSYAYVHDHPTQSLANLSPRYALGIHWENFFITQDNPTEPIPFEPDQSTFDDAADALLADDTEPAVSVEGVEEPGRYWRPEPQTHFSFPLRADGVGPNTETAPFTTTSSVESADGLLTFRSDLPLWAADCEALGEDAPCEDVDDDGLTDAWEDAVLVWLRPTIRMDEAEPFVSDDDALFDVGRVAPADDGGIRVMILQGYTEDYGRCAISFHDGDPERVALNLSPLTGEGAGDAAVVGLYTAAHEGTETDHSTLLVGDDLTAAVLVEDEATGAPRWRVVASDGKHATYTTVDDCEDAEWVLCLEEDCDADGVSDPTDYDYLPPIINAGEDGAPRFTALDAIGFLDEDAWLDQDFCGGQGRGGICSASVREKLLDDPFVED